VKGADTGGGSSIAALSCCACHQGEGIHYSMRSGINKYLSYITINIDINIYTPSLRDCILRDAASYDHNAAYLER
jgi:hypothetical protein